MEKKHTFFENVDNRADYALVADRHLKRRKGKPVADNETGRAYCSADDRRSADQAGERRTALDHRAMVQPGHQRGAVSLTFQVVRF
jgi:hypothetical protein